MILDIPGVSDRRQTPRYEIKLDVDLLLDNGSHIAVATRNISSSGLQIVCEPWATDEIEPRGIQKHTLNHIRLKAITELPVANEAKKLYSICRIISVQRMSQDEFLLSIAFVDFENGSENILDEFLDQYQQKKTVINAYA